MKTQTFYCLIESSQAPENPPIYTPPGPEKPQLKRKHYNAQSWAWEMEDK